jgi:hypothetical protein
MTHFHIILPHIPRCLQISIFLLEFLTKNLYALLLSVILAICPAYHVFLDLITLVILSEKYKYWYYYQTAKCHNLDDISPEGPDILLKTLSQTPSLYYSLMVRDQFHIQSKQELNYSADVTPIIAVMLQRKLLYNVYINFLYFHFQRGQNW